MFRLSTTLLLLFLALAGFAQSARQTQTIRGTITDEASRNPIAGAVVALISDPAVGTTTDSAGRFRLEGVPLGRQSLRISYVGYEERTVPDLTVTAGKEVQLNLTLQENVRRLDGVTISAGRAKDKTQTVNDMALVSARSFNVDDTRKYAGALGDPSRMAANFAGVISGDDSRNDIVVRGNSPTGMLWQLEGLNIPNPNHFGTLTTTGGPVSMLNSNNIDKSDFLTSAYPAQYGNALAGVFDIRLRGGNGEKREYTAQIGFNGFEVGAEGPLSKKTKSSYLVNYRYSTLGVFQALGINFGTGSATPNYQDLNYKIQTAVGKRGTLAAFGILGTSNINFLGSEADTTESNLYTDAYSDVRLRYSTTVNGVSYNHQLSAKTSTKLTLGYSTTLQRFTGDSISYTDRSIILPSGDAKMTTGKLSAVWSLAYKHDRRNSLQAGASYDHTMYNIVNKDYYQGTIERVWVDAQGGFGLAQAYTQWKHRFSTQFSVVGGLHAQYITLNNAAALDPRVNVRYALNARHAFSAGYGLNHQAQNIYTYFIQTPTATGIAETNKDLSFTRSHQYVAGYDWNATQHFRVKAEVYYQALSNVPVEQNPSSFSSLNIGATFTPMEQDSLVNKGTGTNLGLELTLERFFYKGYYFLVTASLFDSKYKGSDGMERNTAFNTGYAANVLAGKEFKVGRRGNVLLLNAKATGIGGRYFSPVDMAATQAAREIRYDEARAYTERQDAYLRMDVKIGYRREFRRSTLEASVDLQNVTNNQNVFSRAYDPRANRLYYNYQQGFFPVPTLRYTF